VKGQVLQKEEKWIKQNSNKVNYKSYLKIKIFKNIIIIITMAIYTHGPQKCYAGKKPVHCLQIVKTAEQKYLKSCSKGLNRDIR